MVVVNAAVAKALNCLMADAFLKIQAQQEATERLIQGDRKSWTRDEMRMLAAQLDQTLLYRWAQFNQVAVCVAATTAFGAICGAADWYAPRPDRFDCRHLALPWQFKGTFRGISVGYEFRIGKAKRRRYLWKRKNCQSRVRTARSSAGAGRTAAGCDGFRFG